MNKQFRSLDLFGFRNWEVDLKGNLRNRETGTYASRNSELNVFLPEEQRTLLDAKGIGIPSTYFVALAWKDVDPSEYQGSKYESHIQGAKRFHQIPLGERSHTGITDYYGNSYWVTKQGEIWNSTRFLPVAGVASSTGYLKVSLGDKQNQLIHRLVAKAFCPIPVRLSEQGYTVDQLVVDHLNNNKQDNRAENLHWITNSENMKKTLYSSASCKYSDFDIEKIYSMLSQGYTNHEISEKLNVPMPTIMDIRKRRILRYDTPKYTWEMDGRKVSQQRLAERDAKVVELFNNGVPRSQIAEEVGLAQTCLWKILSENRDKLTRPFRAPRTELTRDQVIQVCQLMQSGKTDAEVAKEMEISRACVFAIRTKKVFTDIVKDYTWKMPQPKEELLQRAAKVRSIVIEELNHGWTSCAEVSRKYGIPETTLRHHYNFLTRKA